MDTIFMNSENSNASDLHRLLLSLKKKLYICCSIKFGIYYTWKNLKKSYKNNEFKISAPTCDEVFELPAGSYSISDIQDYLQYIWKNYFNPSIRVYINKTENKITFKFKTRHYPKLLTPQKMQLLACTKAR